MRMNINMIGGSGRSGTTILRKIFDQHPDIATVPEWRFLVDPDGLLDFYSTFELCWTPYLYDVKLKRLEKLLRNVGRNNYFGAASSYFLKRLGWRKKVPFRLAPAYSEVLHTQQCCRDYKILVGQLLDDLTEFRFNGQWFGKKFLEKNGFRYGYPDHEFELAEIFRRFYRGIVKSVLNYQDKKHYLEKNTWNILWFDKTLEILPESKLIHIYRDPRDVVSSYMNQPWCPSDPAQAAKYYKDIMQQWWKIKKIIPQESFYEISLELLVSDPETTLRKLCEYMNINWDNSLLKIDLTGSHSGRWKNNLTHNQQKLVCGILENQINELGYE